jgi:hypothetical protein
MDAEFHMFRGIALNASSTGCGGLVARTFAQSIYSWMKG